MLYSLVFALIYFAVLGIIIIFDMKNRKIKKNLRKIIQRHEDEAKEKIKLGILAADTVYRERTETGTVFYEVPKNLKKSVVLNIICFTIIEILIFSGIKIGILLLLSCAVISITYGNKYYYPKEKTKDTLEIINEDFYLNGKLLDIKGYNWGTELFPLFVPEKNLKGSLQTDIMIENNRISEIVDNMIDIIQKKQIPKVKFRLFKMKIMQSMLLFIPFMPIMTFVLLYGSKAHIHLF